MHEPTFLKDKNKHEFLCSYQAKKPLKTSQQIIGALLTTVLQQLKASSELHLPPLPHSLELSQPVVGAVQVDSGAPVHGHGAAWHSNVSRKKRKRLTRKTLVYSTNRGQ